MQNPLSNIVLPMRKQKSAVTAYSYIRFSMLEQAKGHSYQRQLEASRTYAQEKDLRLDENFTLFDKGVSAFRGKNSKEGALAFFLEAIREGRVLPGSVLLVESLDRLSRAQLLEQLNLFLSIVNAGVEIHTLMDRMVYSKATLNNSPFGLIISLSIMARAHEESATKSHRVGAAWKKKLASAVSEKKPMTAMVPYWMKLNREKGTIELIPERARVVRYIFDRVLFGEGTAKKTAPPWGKRQIVRELNRKNTPTWRGGNGWSETLVSRILSHPATFGAHVRYSSRGKFGNDVRKDAEIIVEDYYPAVVTKEEFYRVRAIRESMAPGQRPQKKRVTNLFPHLLHDGVYGGPMTVVRKVGKGDESDALRWTYMVSDRSRTHPDEVRTHLHYGRFERTFLDFVTELDWATMVTKAAPSQVAAAVQSKSAELKEIEKRLHRLVKLAEDSDNPPPDILERIAARRIEAQSAQSELARLEDRLSKESLASDEVYAAAEELRAMAGKGDFESRIRLKEQIRRLVEKIDVFPWGVSGLEGLTQTEGYPTFRIKFRAGLTKWLLTDNVDLVAILDEPENPSAVTPVARPTGTVSGQKAKNRRKPVTQTKRRAKR